MTTMTISGSIVRVGNSAAVGLTTQVLKVAGLAVGQPIEISAAEGCIILRPGRSAVSYDLAQLIAGITDENRHGEIKIGAAIGREGPCELD